MTNKVKLAFEMLEQEMEALGREQQRGVMGGTGDPTDGDIWVVGGETFVWSSASNSWVANELSTVVITRTSSSSSGGSWSWSAYSYGTGSYWTNMLSSGGYVQGGGGSSGGGSTGDGGYNPTNYELARDIAAGAISTGLTFGEYYTTMRDAIFSGTPINTNDLIKNIFDTNPIDSVVADLKGAWGFKGMAILSLTGKVLGYTQAYDSLDTLVTDMQDGDVSMVNIADAAISVGSLCIKSNAVGLAVSAGWLLIKCNVDE